MSEEDAGIQGNVMARREDYYDIFIEAISMNKVLLVTVQGNYNYGNRLQNYALRTIISEMGFLVDDLCFNPTILGREDRRSAMIKWRIWTLLGRRGFRERYAKLRREDRMIRFSERYTPRLLVPAKEVWTRDWSGYAFGVTGSEQVWHNWHHSYCDNELKYYYLSFLPKEKRVSYAPSFGFTAFPEEDLGAHREGLMGMNALSCREAEGCALIRDFTGREAQKVLDPVLLLRPEDWERMEKKPIFSVKRTYLLQFFLGEVTKEYREEIERIRKEQGLELLNINDPSEPEHYGLSPAEFIWLIHHAKAVCTDSFHASAFSVIFGVGLRAFPRVQDGMTDMFGRIRDLLAPLGLMELAYGVGKDGKLSTALDPEAQAHFDAEREKSLLYLKKHLHVPDTGA